MATTPVVDGFTQDVITLVTISDEEGCKKVRETIGSYDPEVRAELLRNTLMAVMAPFMVMSPPFVQSIVARVLMDNVDWDAVVDRLLTVPENN
jgi:hypothetical protein